MKGGEVKKKRNLLREVLFFLPLDMMSSRVESNQIFFMFEVYWS
jgi:hypothetical protein